MQMLEKPNFLAVPQLAHSLLAGRRANLRTFCSAGVNDIVIYEILSILEGRLGLNSLFSLACCWKSECPKSSSALADTDMRNDNNNMFTKFKCHFFGMMTDLAVRSHTKSKL
jgi:hypothetical protein